MSAAAGSTVNPRGKRRRWIVPETLQTSINDCGPAALKSLLEGLGIRATYAWLRAACQTDIDGTSIDGLEELCHSLDLEAEQMVVPRDHLLLEQAQLLPCIAVVKSRLGPHFVVVWNRVGPWVQLMDPSYGRRWLLATDFLRTLMPFSLPVDAEAWRGWAGTNEYGAALDARLGAIGLNKAARRRLLDRALDNPHWRGLGTLDASTRFAAQLVSSGALHRGAEVQRFLEGVNDRADEHGAKIPDSCFSVCPTESAEDGSEQLSLRGAVILRVRAHTAAEQAHEDAHEDADDETNDTPTPRAPPSSKVLSDESSHEPIPHLLRDYLRADHPRERFLLPCLLALGSLGILVELVLFRVLIDVLGRLGLFWHRFEVLAAVLVFTVALLLLELPSMSLVLRAGRRLEARFRLEFARRIPRLADEYLQSRQVSDLAGRIHYATRIRQLPDILAQLFRSAWELVAVGLTIAWLDPRLIPHLLMALTICALLPLVTYRLLQEHDYRVRTLNGSMFRFYLDSLQGLFPVLTHGAERGVQSEHEQILVQWQTASHALLNARMWVEGAQMVLGTASAVWLVLAHLSHAGGAVGGVLLVVYLALWLPMIGQRIALLTRHFVRLRNYSYALLEPLAEPEWRVSPPTDKHADPHDVDEDTRAGIEVELRDLSVLAGGRAVLSSIDLTIQPGEHIAIVGPSGAGKSSLVGLLLGWLRPTQGELLIDGKQADPAVLSALTRQVAWVDPTTHLWNRPLLDNLLFAAPDKSISDSIQAMELRPLLDRLPAGLQTSLGEGGRLLSGGEGQRVRLGRAYQQREARLVLLDEAFRGLDGPARTRLLGAVRSRFREATLLCVTHDIEEALGFDRVLVIEDGRVAEDGDPKALAQTEGSRYRDLLAGDRVLHELLRSSAFRKVIVSGGRVVETEATS